MLRRAVSQLERWRPCAEQVAEQHVSEENHEVWKMAFKKVEALRPSLRFDVVQAEQQQLRTTVYQSGAQHVQPTATSIQNIQNTNHCSLEKSKDLRGSFARASAISLASNSASKRRRAGLGGSTARLRPHTQSVLSGLAVPGLETSLTPPCPQRKSAPTTITIVCPLRRCRWSLLSNLFKGGTVCAAAPSCFSCTN